MKTAFVSWDNRIAPVFDTAQQIYIVETEAGRIVSATQGYLPAEPSVRKCLSLVEMGVAALVCGAISKPMQGLVAAYGIRVIPFIAGKLNDVVEAWLGGNLKQDFFTMPGCGKGTDRGFK
jgi:predicted Fe-Mo cluster-binding NifX family protein